MQPDINSLLRADDLDAAIAAANAAVRRAPSDAAARVRLAELLVFAGNLQRADVVLDAAATADPRSALVVAEFRQLLRAEMARHQFWRDGRLPQVLDAPTSAETALMAAIVAWRLGDSDLAAHKADEAEQLRPRAPARIGAQLVSDFRDADDLCAGMLDVLTSTGKFYWLPIARVATLTFHKPDRLRDLAWRRASISVTGGPEGAVFIPALYMGRHTPASNALRLGRATAWTDEAPVKGIGQRIFLAGDQGISIMDLTHLEFGSAT
jgi:type VI secretion system protein ImpE